jgi:hypothetical protein
MSKEMKRFVMMVFGAILLIAGIIIVLMNWTSIIVLFKGGIGLALALIGLTILYLAGQ